jgi:hypothetical protein
MVGKAGAERFSAVLPILNRGCSVPTTVPLPLSDEITFRKIKGDDLAIITEKDDDAASFLKGGTYTLTFETFEPRTQASSLNAQVLAALFALNVIGGGCPLSIEKAYVIRSLRKTDIHETRLVPGHQHSSVGKFEIAKGTDLSYASNLFKAACKALAAHPPLRITLSRFNSSMGRSAYDDRIIDLCIALESVFQAQTEISFQFALYNALLSENDPQKRLTIFKLLKKLYSHRSNVVHGNKDLDEPWARDNWPDLLRIAKASILRKIDYLGGNEHVGWRDQLETLALGTDDG